MKAHSKPESTSIHRLRHRAIVMTASLCLLVQPGQATRRDPGNAGAEPDAHHSYVRSTDRKDIVSSKQFAADIKANFTGASVDILMNQCFDGGFLRFVDQTGKPYTIATSTGWGKYEWSLALPADGTPLTFVENYTRSWRKDTQLDPTAGLFAHYKLAANDGLVWKRVPADRYAPPGWTNKENKTFTDYTQYQSPDAKEGGANDSRPLLAKGKGNRYAILVSWGIPDEKPADDGAANLARMKNVLINTLGMSTNNIVVLYAKAKRTDHLPEFTKLKGDGDDQGEDLLAYFIDGPNTRDSWIAALKGSLFVNKGGTLGITYGPDDQLFVYFTGHGGNENVAPPAVADAGGLHYRVPLTNAFDTTLVFGDDSPDYIADADGKDLIQISTRVEITDPTVVLAVNGTAFGPMSSMEVNDPAQTLALGEFYQGHTYTYQVRVPHTLLATDPQTAAIDLIFPVSRYNQDPVAAFTLAGGQQEYMAVIATCDINHDGVIDNTDLNLILTSQGKANPGDSRDVDLDGFITTRDANLCAQYCTNQNCAPK